MTRGGGRHRRHQRDRRPAGHLDGRRLHHREAAAAGAPGRAGPAAASAASVLATQAVASPDWTQAILLLMFAYGGFEAPLIPAGEARSPRRDTALRAAHGARRRSPPSTAGAARRGRAWCPRVGAGEGAGGGGLRRAARRARGACWRAVARHGLDLRATRRAPCCSRRASCSRWPSAASCRRRPGPRPPALPHAARLAIVAYAALVAGAGPRRQLRPGTRPVSAIVRLRDLRPHLRGPARVPPPRRGGRAGFRLLRGPVGRAPLATALLPVAAQHAAARPGLGPGRPDGAGRRAVGCLGPRRAPPARSPIEPRRAENELADHALRASGGDDRGHDPTFRDQHAESRASFASRAGWGWSWSTWRPSPRIERSFGRRRLPERCARRSIPCCWRLKEHVPRRATS